MSKEMRKGLVAAAGILAACAGVAAADTWEGVTPAFRADTRAGRGAMEPHAAEWAAWDTAWDESASVEVTLTRPDGTTERLGGASGTGAAGLGSAAWRPREGESGRYLLVHVSRDASGRETGRMTAEFVRILPLEVATVELPEAKVGEAYTAMLEAIGGTAPYAWAVAGGRLPAGIALSADGILAGTPLEAGEYAFAVRVGDAAGGEAAGALALAVISALEWTVQSPVPVPFAWLEAYPSHLAAYGGDYEAAAANAAANGMAGWECYVAGLDPTDADASLKTQIAFLNGLPSVTPDPDLNEGGTKTNRVYRVFGRQSLTDGEWAEASNPAEWDAKDYRFFRMTVKMPE